MKVYLHSYEVPAGAKVEISNNIITISKDFDIELGDLITDGNRIVKLEDIDGRSLQYREFYDYREPDHFSETPYMQSVGIYPNDNWRQLTDDERKKFKSVLEHKFGRTLEGNNIVFRKYWWINGSKVVGTTRGDYMNLSRLGIKFFVNKEEAEATLKWRRDNGI